MSGRRFALFAVVFLVVAVWVAASDGDHAAVARHFLRGLLRALF
ncbi:MAG TPA: hypothetical protein VFZ18_02285 [Longimicrobiaceae bacterium]|jgi:tellurite resistance protein